MMAQPSKASTLKAVRVRELLTYCPTSGEFRRRISRPGCAAGELAGTISNGYRQIQIDGIICKASRLAWLYQTGAFPADGLLVDHINGVRDDDRWLNLRLATPAQNARNRRPKEGRKVCGVYRNGSLFQAVIEADGVRHQLGSFKCEETAIAARCDAERHYFGEFARQVREARDDG